MHCMYRNVVEAKSTSGMPIRCSRSATFDGSFLTFDDRMRDCPYAFRSHSILPLLLRGSWAVSRCSSGRTNTRVYLSMRAIVLLMSMKMRISIRRNNPGSEVERTILPFTLHSCFFTLSSLSQLLANFDREAMSHFSLRLFSLTVYWWKCRDNGQVTLILCVQVQPASPSRIWLTSSTLPQISPVRTLASRDLHWIRPGMNCCNVGARTLRLFHWADTPCQTPIWGYRNTTYKQSTGALSLSGMEEVITERCQYFMSYIVW